MNKTKTTFASRLAARKAKRNRPVSVLSKRARTRRCAAQHLITARVFAGDVPVGEVTK